MSFSLCLGKYASAIILTIEIIFFRQFGGTFKSILLLKIRRQKGHSVPLPQLLPDGVEPLGILQGADGQGRAEIIKAMLRCRLGGGLQPQGKAHPALVIGVPVGFVNVIEAKNMLAELTDTPRIIAHGNKGGTTVACAIINAILYGM